MDGRDADDREAEARASTRPVAQDRHLNFSFPLRASAARRGVAAAVAVSVCVTQLTDARDADEREEAARASTRPVALHDRYLNPFKSVPFASAARRGVAVVAVAVAAAV